MSAREKERIWPEHPITGALVCERCKKEYPAKTYQIRRRQRFCCAECRYGTVFDRFWSKVHKTEKCWNWIGSQIAGRYGGFNNGQSLLAHRFSWMIHFGKIPDGLCVCHKCDNGFCVRPDHLFLGTQLENVRDMHQKGRANKSRGSEHRNSKLNEEGVMEIRRKISSGIPALEIAQQHQISRCLVNGIKMGRAWKWL